MALWLLASVWCLLLLGAALRPALGSGAALISSYAASAALLLWARPRQHRSVSVAGAAIAATAGFAALPAWLVIVAIAGVALGLEHPRAAPHAPPAPVVWLANVALAPLFEELLYRERVLPALRARVGAPLALILSSALFAAPHLEPWSLLTTFLVGLALGAVFLATGRVELCIAHHAGLNAAALACGLPPSRDALPPFAAACVSGTLLALAIARTRGRAARPAVHAHVQEDLGTEAKPA